MTIVPYKEFLELAGAPAISEDLGRYESRPITQSRKDMLHRRGIGYSDIDNCLKADHVLAVANYRMKHGLATPGQMRMMRRLGVVDVGKKTFNEAKFIIGNSCHW